MSWPKNIAGRAGDLDHNKCLVGDDLIRFVSGKLIPYLHGFCERASGPNTIEYKIGEIFGEIKNKIQSGYNLRSSSSTSMSRALAPRPKSTSYRTSTKPKSRTWATPDVMAANTTRHAR